MFSCTIFVQIQIVLELLSRLSQGGPLLPQPADRGLVREEEGHRKEEGHRGLARRLECPMKEEGHRGLARKMEGHGGLARKEEGNHRGNEGFHKREEGSSMGEESPKVETHLYPQPQSQGWRTKEEVQEEEEEDCRGAGVSDNISNVITHFRSMV